MGFWLPEGFPSWQMETVVLDENILELFDRAADGGFADAIGGGDVSLGAILAPIHQRHQQSIFQT